MGYKTIQQTSTVAAAIADGLNEIESLKDEMGEWRDNMSGTGLENTEKYSMVEEAADTLESAHSSIESGHSSLEGIGVYEDILGAAEIKYFEQVNANKRRGCSRSVRLGNAILMINAGLEKIEAYLEENSNTADEAQVEVNDALSSAKSEIEDGISDAEGVDFPGMF